MRRKPLVEHYSIVLSLIALSVPVTVTAQTSSGSADAESSTKLEAIQVQGNWLGSDGPPSLRTFPGARTVVDKEEIDNSGATSIGDMMRRVPGVQSTDNSGTAGSAVSLSIGVRGLTGRYSPRSTVLLDGIPLAVAPYGQPQLGFAPISLGNIDSIDVVRGGGAVRYGPQNVGGIINFKTRPIPTTAGLSGFASLRYNDFGQGGHSTLLSTAIGTRFDTGLGVALQLSSSDGSGWRQNSQERVNDVAVKFRYELSGTSEIYGKVSYYDVKSRTPGGLTVAQFNANPFQNTRPTDYWNGDRKAFDIGYVNTLSDTQEFEIRTYLNQSFRQSALINAARTQLAFQPRTYETFGIEPRYTQRFRLGAVTQDVTVGYRYIRERGDDRSYNQTLATGALGATTIFGNATDAHSMYIDDKIAIGQWRITPGVRFEHISSTRNDFAAGQSFDTHNNKALPSLNVAYLLTPAVTVFANYNTSFGPVQNLQLNSQTPANPLRPEVAKTAEVGARWQDRQISAEVTLYRMRFDNQIQQIAGSNPAVFQNIGATKHDGIETAFDYTFDKAGPLAGLNLFANFTYTRALQESGPTAGLELPFYSRRTDTLGASYERALWAINLSTTHQSSQFSDNANTVAEDAAATTGRVPAFRLWNAQARVKIPRIKGADVLFGVNNLSDKRFYTRNVDGNPGRMVGTPRTIYVQGRFSF